MVATIKTFALLIIRLLIRSLGGRHDMEGHSMLQRLGVNTFKDAELQRGPLGNTSADDPWAMVPKTKESNFARFLFIAGLGGTGHHGWQDVLLHAHCEDFPTKHLTRMWYGSDEEASPQYDIFVEELRAATALAAKQRVSKLYCLNVGHWKHSMLSYPGKNSKRHHPDLVTLALAAEEARADLRVLVIDRQVAPVLVSLVIHRQFLEMGEEAQQMANQAALLHMQLESIDPHFFACVSYTDVVPHANEIAGFIASGLSAEFAVNFADKIKHDYVGSDNETESLLEIEAYGVDIRTKMAALERFRRLMWSGPCRLRSFPLV